MDPTATLLAFISPGLAEALAVIGTTLGIRAAASVGLSVISDEPRMAGRVYALAFFPATQTLVYGFVYMYMMYSSLANLQNISTSTAAALLAISVFVGLAQMMSAWMQGKVCADGIAQLVKTEGRIFGSAIVLAAYEEMFGILGMVFGYLMGSLALGLSS